MFMNVLLDICNEFWEILLDSSPYILLGIFIAGFLKMFLNPGVIRDHLGQGRIASVFKAAFLGVPLPL